jgi:hypothetical protein
MGSTVPLRALLTMAMSTSRTVLQDDSRGYGGISKETVVVPRWLCNFTELFQLLNYMKLGLS